MLYTFPWSQLASMGFLDKQKPLWYALNNENKNVLYLLSFFTLTSCISGLSAAEKLSFRWPKMVEQLTQRKFDNSKAVDEMSRERSENRIPFTINFKDCEGKLY